MYALECGDYCDIITWSSADGGKSFYILDPRAFSDLVLPALFKVAKYDSFQRKLHRWGFIKKQRSRAGTAIVSYAHEIFRKGNFALASTMTCSGPGSASRRITSAYTAPIAGVASSKMRYDEDAEDPRSIAKHYVNKEAAGSGSLSTNLWTSSLSPLPGQILDDGRVGPNLQQQDRRSMIADSIVASSITSSCGGGYSQQQQQQQRLYQSMHQQPQASCWSNNPSLLQSHNTMMRSGAPASSVLTGTRNLLESRRNVQAFTHGTSLSSMPRRSDDLISGLRRDPEEFLSWGLQASNRTFNMHGNTIPDRRHMISGSRDNGHDGSSQQYQQHRHRPSVNDGLMDARNQRAIIQEALDVLNSPSPYAHQF